MTNFSVHNIYFSLFMIVAVLSVCSGCSIKKSVAQSDTHESTKIEYLHDTLIINHRDTIYIRTDSLAHTTDNTIIEFAEGGTYNTQTGEMQNVQKIKNNKQTIEHKQTDWHAASNTELTEVATNDQQQTTNNQSLTTNDQRLTTSWWKWLLAGIAIGVALPYIIKLILKFI